MSVELRIAAYALSSTGKELNLDNMYANGRFVNVGSDTKSVINKVSHDDFQVYGVCDSEIGVDDDRSVGVNNSSAVMQMLSHLHGELQGIGKIDKDTIWETLVDTNRTMKRQKNQLGRDVMGTSFAGLFLRSEGGKDRGLAVHLGDSRIYVVRGGRMLQITDDHLESSDMLRLGVISPAQAEIHKSSSNLTAYLGMDDIYDAKNEAFSKYFVFYPGDTFILCTDGFSDAVGNEEMERLVRLLKDATIDQLAQMLMKNAIDKHTDDDMTIMVLRIEDAGSEAPTRGTATIPRKENYEKKSPAPVPSHADPEAEAEEESSSILSRIPRRKAERISEEEVDASDFNEEREMPDHHQTQRFSPIQEDPEDYDEEPSLLDNLLSNPKRLVLLGAIALAVIALLVVIIVAVSGKDEPSTSSPQAGQSESSQVQTISQPENNSVVTPPADNSSLAPTDSSAATDSSDTSSNSGSDSSTADSNSDSSTTGGPSSLTEYTVQDGDYFYDIVIALYGDADLELMEAFAAYNDMTLESNLLPGMTLKVPPVDELQ